MTRRLPKQRELAFPRWGGARRGAGRKPAGPRARVPHVRRAPLASRFPVHVTVRVCHGLPSLRSSKSFGVVRAALAAGSARGAFRLVHFSVQADHVHLIVEAKDRPALSRGAQGLLVRVAKALNRLWRRRGSIFADRHHDHVLRTPREVRNALRYVLTNARHHGAHFAGVDPCSSGAWFDGWRGRDARLGDGRTSFWPRARTWLLALGWKRHGAIPLPSG